MKRTGVAPYVWQKARDPLGAVPALGGNKQARMWLQWACERDGVALPTSYAVSFERDAQGAHTATIWDKTPRGWRNNAKALVKLPMPAHCVPVKRADLWHEAHQAGLSTYAVHARGQGRTLPAILLAPVS